MIQTKFFCVEPEGSIHMVMCGHAGFAPKGRDLICAGASTLACTLAEGVMRLYEQGMLRRYPRVEIREGWAEVIAQPKKAFFQEVLMLFWMTELGISLLTESFPQYVGIQETMRMEREGKL